MIRLGALPKHIKKTIIFDLDDTLAYCVKDRNGTKP